MPPAIRTLALVAHIVCAVGWLGAALAYLALVVTMLTTADDGTARAAFLAMGIVLRWAILPLALAAFLSGLVQALGTRWGLVRHRWVLAKFLLTVVAIAALLEYTGEAGAPAALRNSGHLVHAGGGLAVLLATTTLAVSKPRGLTRFGRRRQPIAS